jgi:type II secretory pathway pseudopilin PulG
MTLLTSTARTEIARRLVAAKGRLAPAVIFRNSDTGAIDLASIMVGVLVIGIIAGVIAATVFAVIPWSQDNAAKQSLDAVKTAESVQLAQSAGLGAAKFADSTTLEGTTNANGASLLQASPNIKVVVSSDGAHFIAASKSDHANTVFYITDDGQKATTTPPTTAGDAVAPTWNATTSAWQ